MRFVALGDVMVDVVADRLPASGERVHGSVRVRAGGSAVNAALVARAVGADTQIVGRFEIVCMKDDYGVVCTSPFGAGDAFAAAFQSQAAPASTAAGSFWMLGS